jgi:hypothetical protein
VESIKLSEHDDNSYLYFRLNTRSNFDQRFVGYGSEYLLDVL